MLPPAHYAAGLAAGLATAKATGSPGLGLAAAALTHLPLDYLVDEYWDWQPGEQQDMVLLTLPLGATLAILTAWLGLGGGTWPIPWAGCGLGWWPLLWGVGGLLPDIIDAAVKWMTAKIGWGVERYGQQLRGIELFPCHYYSPWYWGQAWPRMLTFYGTLAAEYAVAVPALLAIWLMMG